jgi:hypothetical protein
MNMNKTSQWAGRLVSLFTITVLLVTVGAGITKTTPRNSPWTYRILGLLECLSGVFSILCLVAAFLDYLRNRKKSN